MVLNIDEYLYNIFGGTIMKKYDLIVIGMGPAGMVVSGMASKMGLKVLGIDANKVGGECLNTGCIPSKALLKMSSVKATISNLDKFGLKLNGQVEVSSPMQVVRNHLKNLTGQSLIDNFKLVDLIIKKGKAKFVDEKTIEVDGEKFTSDLIFIAVGTVPLIPNIEGLKKVPYLTNENMFELTSIPKRLSIIGGGAIGSEMAQAFSRLGSKVVIVQMDDNLIPRSDLEAAEVLQNVFHSEGIEVYNSTKISKVEQHAENILMYTDKGVFESDQILIATGKKQILEPLSLENAGVIYNQNGVVIDEFNRTNKKHIYAIGDCNGQWHFSHAAMHQGMVSLMQAMSQSENPKYMRSNYPVPWTIFTSPEFAQVGLTEQQMKEQNKPYIVAKEYYNTYARAITDGASEGFVKVLTDENGTIYGATIIGKAASEMIQEWTMAIQNNLSMFNILMMQHAFPTLSLMNKIVAEKWMMKLAKSGQLSKYL